ncbi:MAG: TfoX/Sxy family protein [Oscillospiraceae bacterium]|jgi:DNA transformation protein|nr:TfoX/Sxy family protein [Oscillospiraceae bacterium]
MGILTTLPNISKVNEAKLIKAGIDTPEKLRELGSREALMRVRIHADAGACLNMLYGLEGAIRGIRWHDLPNDVKKELKDFHKSL